MASYDPVKDFSALRTQFDDDGNVTSTIETLTIDMLSPGNIIIQTYYAGVNYKDALAITGAGRVMKSFPRIGGIELVGEIVHSETSDIKVSEMVLVHGWQTGVEYDGGFAEFVRLPADRIMAVPLSLSPFETAVIGLPGFTAGMALDRFEQHGLTPGSGPVAVTGAFGAVGMLAILLLARAGYEVIAITRRKDRGETLRALGASDVFALDELLPSRRPLEKARFAAAIDNVGGEVLSWLLKSMNDNGLVAAVGNAGGNEFAGNVLPFIMRRVQIFGIVANADWETRHRIWQKLAGPWKPDLKKLYASIKLISLADLPEHCRRQLQGNTFGRTLVQHIAAPSRPD
jgi:acrylyl-CoA reductase (NADPH)